MKKKCSEAKEQWLNKQCSEIGNKLNMNAKYAHKRINEISGKPRYSSSCCIKPKNRTVIMEKHKIRNGWTEYTKELFDDHRMPEPIITKNMEGPSIMADEVRQAIKSVKSNKATDSDGIPVEIIQCFDELLLTSTQN